MDWQHLELSDTLKHRVKLAYVFFERVAVGITPPELRLWRRTRAAQFHGAFKGQPQAILQAVSRSRALYHSVGVDPTKDRPFSERLLRSVLRSGALPEVNSFLDAMSFASLSLQAPIGVYDWDKIRFPVSARMGYFGECYRTSGGDRKSVAGKLVLADRDGPFGNPSQDSERTRVTRHTVRSLVVTWVPADARGNYVKTVVDVIMLLGGRFCEASVADWGVLGRHRAKR